VPDSSGVTTFLFTDIEGSTRLWERAPDLMHAALAQHDAIARASVEQHRGSVVKMIGDGVHAAFADPLDALRATLRLQLALADPAATNGVELRIRCGLHAGIDVRRDNDYYGNAVNRAARIMSTAHGGQILLSQIVVDLVGDRLPDDVSLCDLGAVRLRDLAQSERVYQVLHPRLRQQFPALRSLEVTPNNLPQQLTSFIGREHEVAQVTKQLAETRLLTLLGIGGLGKSRLSLQVAAEVLDDYPAGVWFVELAPIADASLVPQVVASVLGVKEEAGRPVLEALVKFVKDRHLLLVLDNCEHLAQACAELAKQLLESGPRVKILASSREPLNIRGEKAYPLAPLATPLPRQKLSRDALSQFAAVRLFVERATAAQPAFSVTDENAAAVAEICHQLDGIPLALELAAARTRAMSVASIAARLHDRFRLLGGGDRTALPRQQTLRALIDWSHDLLTDEERALFRRLAVFAGGFTLEAAEKVGAGGALDERDVLDLVTRLVEKSLVALAAGGERYHVLETVRQYAQERLDESGDVDEARTRHLVFFLAYVELARPELLGPNQGLWLARLDLDRENILSAHAWCDRATGGNSLGLRLVRSMRIYWFSRGLLGLGRRLTAEALARPDAQERNLLRCRVLSDAGQLALYMGQYAEAQQLLEESLAIAREIDDPSRVTAVLQPLGMASLGRGDTAAARRHLEEAVTLAQALGNKREIAAALSALAQLHRFEGALDTAEPLCTQAVAIARELDDRESIAIGLLNLAMVAIGRRSGQQAREILVEVLTIAEQIGSKPAGQCAIEVSAGLAATSAQWTLAARFFGAAENQAAQTGLRRDSADEAFLAPLIADVRGALGPEAFDDAERAGKALPFDQAMAEVRAWLDAAPGGSPRSDPLMGRS
jgi:predicted ATPase/class 3 adenylate cyclase